MLIPPILLIPLAELYPARTAKERNRPSFTSMRRSSVSLPSSNPGRRRNHASEEADLHTRSPALLQLHRVEHLSRTDGEHSTITLSFTLGVPRHTYIAGAA